ncbi:universal stress protein [Streptomyces sp. NPDC059637]|uniref:universal stress protein n=1 Tax=Streptomyces TaxID=1883 RepID=UPI0031D1E76C
MEAVGLPLVVGTDGSEFSLQAVDWAADEAARRRVPLRIVYASLWERYEGQVPSEEGTGPLEGWEADRILDTALERARARRPGLEVSGEVLPDDAADVLADEGRNASLLVVGSRGRGELAELLLGSVSLAVAARADCPVVVVRGPVPLPGRERPRQDRPLVVLGVDDAGENASAVAFAFEEAQLRGAELLALHAWRAPKVTPQSHPLIAGDAHAAPVHHAQETLADALARPGREHPRVTVRRAAVEGSAHKALLDASEGAEMVVVGTRRRLGHFGLQLGRTNHAVLHHAPCPVAVVPQVPR